MASQGKGKRQEKKCLDGKKAVQARRRPRSPDGVLCIVGCNITGGGDATNEEWNGPAGNGMGWDGKQG